MNSLKTFFGFLIVLLTLVITIGCSDNRLPLVRIVTSFGNVLVEIDTLNAPVTAGNFLYHVENGTYNSALLYRVVRPDNQPDNLVKIQVIQGGLYSEEEICHHICIRHETTKETGLKHLNGTVSLARSEPGTASTKFFICIGNQPELDFGGKRNPDGQGFAAFGRVVKGMNVVKEIQQQKDTNQYLTEPVLICITTLKKGS